MFFFKLQINVLTSMDKIKLQNIHAVASLGGGGGPSRATQSRGDKSTFFAAEFTKNTGETIIWKAKRVGVVTMTKKVHNF